MNPKAIALGCDGEHCVCITKNHGHDANFAAVVLSLLDARARKLVLRLNSRCFAGYPCVSQTRPGTAYVEIHGKFTPRDERALERAQFKRSVVGWRRLVVVASVPRTIERGA